MTLCLSLELLIANTLEGVIIQSHINDTVSFVSGTLHCCWNIWGHPAFSRDERQQGKLHSKDGAKRRTCGARCWVSLCVSAVTVVETFTCTQVWELKEVRVSTVWTCSVGHWSQRQGLPWTEGWPRVTCCGHLDSLSGRRRCWVMLSEIPPLWQSVGRKWGVRAAR